MRASKGGGSWGRGSPSPPGKRSRERAEQEDRPPLPPAGEHEDLEGGGALGGERTGPGGEGLACTGFGSPTYHISSRADPMTQSEDSCLLYEPLGA